MEELCPANASFVFVGPNAIVTGPFLQTLEVPCPPRIWSHWENANRKHQSVKPKEEAARDFYLHTHEMMEGLVFSLVWRKCLNMLHREGIVLRYNVSGPRIVSSIRSTGLQRRIVIPPVITSGTWRSLDRSIIKLQSALCALWEQSITKRQSASNCGQYI